MTKIGKAAAALCLATSISAASFVAGNYHGQAENEKSAVTKSISRTSVSVQSERENGMYCASKNSDKYHRISCRHVDNILEKNLIYFETEEEAAARRDPCSVCKP